MPVRSHYRETEHKRVHVQKHTREVDSGAPLQFNLEEVLGPEHYGTRDERCSSCGRYRPVYQRDLTGDPVCRDCHAYQIEDHRERQLELERQERDYQRREREWERHRNYR